MSGKTLNRKIKVGDREFELRYTIESWKRLEEVGINPFNAEEMLGNKPGSTLSHIIRFGLSPKDREAISEDELDSSLDFKVVHKVRDIIVADCQADQQSKGKSAPKK